MRVHNGIGLAAPQVGITKRLFVCEFEGQSLFLINPQIESMSGQTGMVEGCLSLPDVEVNVQRSEHVHVRGYDAEGRSTRFGMTGLWARVLQHEYDHLNGVLICDHDQKGSVDEA
jgi:peptide deformylase